MYRANRIFCHTDFETGANAWYFEAREGIKGPFATEALAKKKLSAFVQQCIETGNTGGRASTLSIEPETTPSQRLDLEE